MQKAAQCAGAADFIIRLPESYQTLIGERGYKLSGGERQRVALARALLRNPEILILDEATSSLDSHSEKMIARSLKALQGSKTFVIVAHRLSTIDKADRIFVLEEGKIIEQGTHAELIAMKKRYNSLWELQTNQQGLSCS